MSDKHQGNTTNKWFTLLCVTCHQTIEMWALDVEYKITNFQMEVWETDKRKGNMEIEMSKSKREKTEKMAWKGF